MLAPTRHRQLLEILNEKGSVRTAEIAEIFKVTEETVRRDFEKLEKEGALLRAHGGAIRLDAPRREMPVKDRAAQNSAAKRAIAQTAARWIEPGQIIFLDPSTTVQQLARVLPDQPLTVLTTSLQIPDILAGKPAIDVILLGGHVRASSQSCVGYPAELISDLYRIDAAFISCRGIDARDGLSEATEDQARLKRHILNRVSSLYLLADASKANVSSTHYFAKNSDIDLWFTDADPDPQLAKQLREQNVKIEVCPATS